MSDLIRVQNKVIFPGDSADPRLTFGGKYHGILIRDGQIIDEWEDPNLVVNQGLDHILGVEFTGVSQITSWYIAPFGNNYTPVASDTAATIVANAGEITAYTSSTRVGYVGVEGSQQVTNTASVATFTFNASAAVYGAFLASASSKSSTSGTLFSAAQFSAVKNVVSGDQLLLTYTVGAASS